MSGEHSSRVWCLNRLRARKRTTSPIGTGRARRYARRWEHFVLALRRALLTGIPRVRFVCVSSWLAFLRVKQKVQKEAAQLSLSPKAACARIHFLLPFVTLLVVTQSDHFEPAAILTNRTIMFPRLRFPALLLLLAALVAPAQVFAQTAALSGQVQDPSGAVVPSA